MKINIRDKTCILSKQAFLWAVLSVAVCAYPESVVYAQEKPDDYIARGLTYKGFVYSPSLVVSSQYNSNVFADKDNEATDYVHHVKPGLKITKRYGAFNFRFDGDADIKRYTNNSSNNKEDYSGSFAGTYEINSGWSLPFGLKHIKRYREYGDPQAEGSSAEPLSVTTNFANAGLMRRFNRLSVGLIGTYTDNTFEDGVSRDGSSMLVFSDGDRRVYKGSLIFEYDFLRKKVASPVEASNPDLGHTFFTHISQAKHKYENNAYEDGSFSGYNQDRTSYSVLSGFNLNYKDIVFGKIAAGYTMQKFDEEGRDDINSVLAEMDMSYQYSGKHLLGLSIQREINADRIVETDYDLSSTYELLHNLFLNTRLSYDTFEFTPDTGVKDREDKNYGAKIGLEYLLNENWSAGVGAGYLLRESTEPTNEFDRYVIGLQLTGKL